MAGPAPLKELGRKSAAQRPQDIANPHNPKKKPTKKHEILGNPPAHLNIMECGCWYEFKREMPWLTVADSTLVEMASKLRAVLVAGELGVKEYGALTRLVLQLRGTAMAVDRQPHARGNDDEAPEGSVEDEMFG